MASKKHLKIISGLVVILAVGAAALGYMALNKNASGPNAQASTAEGLQQQQAQSAAGQPSGPSWRVRCNDSEEMRDKPRFERCEVFTRVSMRETGQRLLEFAMNFTDNGNPGRGIIILPLGVLLTEEGRIQIDEDKSYQFRVRYCDSGGCYAYLSLNETLVSQLRGAESFTIHFKTAQNQNVQMQMPLDGLGAAIDETTKS